MNFRNRTPSEFVSYDLYLYFSGLSLRRTTEGLTCFIKRNLVLYIYNGTGFKNIVLKDINKKKKNSRMHIDETMIKVGSGYIWLWVVIESKTKAILSTKISQERNIFVAERFVSDLVKIQGKHPFSSSEGTWHPQAYRFLKLGHHIHSPFEKSIIERTMQFIKDRTESFDDYFPCRVKDCKLKHISNWLNFFVDYHNNEISSVK